MAAEGSSATWRAEASNHGEAAEDCDKAYSQSLIILSCMLDYRLGNKNAMLALDIVCVLERVTYLRPSSVGFSDSVPRHARVVRCADGLADCPYVLYGNLGSDQGEPVGQTGFRDFQDSEKDGDGSKSWYLVNPKIAGKWMFIPLKMYL